MKDRNYPLELNNKKEWEISSIWLNMNHSESDSLTAVKWLNNKKTILPPIPNYYNGQILKAKLIASIKNNLYDICDYRIERIYTTYYSNQWNLSFDCRKINHGHSYTLYEKNFIF